MAAAARNAEPAPQTILVLGSHPGPGLWKVSKGEHVLWVFGAYSPLPVGMKWRSREVEDIVAASQEYLKPPMSRVNVGFFKGLGALPFLVGIKDNPGGATLKEVLPPEVHARWQVLKQRYFADDADIERQRPSFVAAELTRRALKDAGLAYDHEVRRTIEGIARKYKLRITDASVEDEIEAPVKAVRAFRTTALDDVPCLAKTIERLENDLDAMRDLANAWAVGELDAIRKLDYAERSACAQAVTSSTLARQQPELLTLPARAAAAWVAAAEKALAANKRSFAIVQVRDILDPKGVIALLREKGYTVEEPE